MTGPSLTRWLWVACALCAALLASASSAAAQVAVLRVDPSAEALCQAIEAGLGNLPRVPDPGYLAEAQQQGLDPGSDQALTLLVPLLGIRLAIVPQSADLTSTLIEFRDGQTGAGLGTVSIALEGGAVGWQGQRLLQLEVQRRLGGAPAVVPPPSGLPPVQPPDAEGGPERGDDELYLSIFAGTGMGMRDVSWPAAAETNSVESGAFLAVELGASFGLRLSPSIALGPELVYQTSLDHQIEEAHIDGVSETLDIRVHRFEALLALGIGDSDGVRIVPELGYALRNLRPAVHHLLTPSFTLAGPMVRLKLHIPLGDIVAFSLAPELQYLVVGEAFQELGAKSSGLAFGGQAGFEIAISHAYVIELSYREAHALVPSTLGDDATDVERFATARFRWQP